MNNNDEKTDIKENDFNTKQIRMLYVKINSYGIDKHLDVLDKLTAREMVNELVEEIKESEEKDVMLV